MAAHGRDDLALLATLVRERNGAEARITKMVGRPALIGHVGEFIASRVFGIELQVSASSKAIDGRFTNGPLAGRSVNVKWYAKLEGLLDIRPDALPDYFLVLAGPREAGGLSLGKTRPWLIESVYVFDAPALVARLRQRRVKIGVATSVQRVLWDEAEVHPASRNAALVLTDGQHRLLALFAGCRADKTKRRVAAPSSVSSVWEAIRTALKDGDELLTPGRGVPPTAQKRFWVPSVGPDFIQIEVGTTHFRVKVPASAFEAVIEHLQGHVGTLRVASLHTDEALPQSVDKVVRETVGWNLASGNYVAAILEHAGLVEYVMKGRQKHVALRRLD